MFNLLHIFALLLTSTIQPSPIPEIWAEPVPFFDQQVESDYLSPVFEYGPGHRGVDFQPGVSELVAPETSRVSFVGKVVNRELLTLLTNEGRKISFEPVCSSLKLGDTVKKGQPIGSYCLSDEDYQEHCFGCVHISVRTEFGYLSPMYFFGKLKPSKLSA